MSKELKLAIKAAKEAGRILLRFYNKKSISHKLKKDKTILTEADLASDKKITGLIKTNFPSHSILSEESQSIKKQSDFLWIIDPLDGTTDFFHHFPFFTVSIGLAHKEEIILGVINNPVTDELYYAEKGKGCYLNNKKISVSSINRLRLALVDFDSGHQKNSKKLLMSLYKKLDPLTKIRVRKNGALDLAYVASGRLEVAINIGSKPWDYAAGSILVREAGGLATNLRGEPFSTFDNNIFAGNESIHQQVLRIIEKK